MEDVYRWRVGTTDVSGPVIGLRPIRKTLKAMGITHFAFLLNRDLFEYGPKGWERHVDVGRDSKYDWDALGTALNGTTYVSPDRLETAINNSGEWVGNKYNVIEHNCQNFVQFCMRALGCPESMIMKKGPVYRDQRRKLK